MWEVFYTPHTDDECIGMAGAIVNARELGHDVLVVLVTDNLPSTRGARKFSDHDVAMERRKEWHRALARLDVTETQYWEISEYAMIRDRKIVWSEILSRMISMHHEREVVHHHSVWGADDVHVEVTEPTLAHVLCAEAATMLRQQERFSRVSLHGVYIYSRPMERRVAPTVRHLSAREFRKKNEALACFQPGPNSIGYGWTSVPELISSAMADSREFTQEIPYVAGR